MLTPSLANLRRRLTLVHNTAHGVETYLASHEVRKLQLGTGTNVLEDWLNTDLAPSFQEVFYLDSTRRFLFDDATFDYAFSEHHIEHISYDEGLFTLQECYRVLKPGGTIRLATPDLAALLGLYTREPDELQQRYMHFITERFLPGILIEHPVFVINNAFRNWGHQFLYDRAILQRTLEEVGFTDICFTRPGESNDQHLRDIEKHGKFIEDEEMNQFETMVVEGKHPL